MGACQTNNTTTSQFPAVPTQSSPQINPSTNTQNPFFSYDARQVNELSLLSNYQFHSKYADQFIGDCSVIQEKSTGDLYLCKELIFSTEDQMRTQIGQLEERKNKLTSQNVIRIKEVIVKSTDGFFGEKKKVLIIIDYPFMSFQKQISNRITKKISFTKQEIINFLNSTIRGYSAIERAGYHTDKIRLKNIFVGIKDKSSIIKVAENSMIEPKSNFQYMVSGGGPHNVNNRDIYLSPEQYLAWTADNKSFQPTNKSGVYSLGMCVLDVCIMDPSREIYHFTENKIDQVQAKNRVEIVGKKYGANIEKLLRQMLLQDPQKRISFTELQQMLPNLTKNENEQSLSKMHLSVIPSQRSTFINNDNKNLRSSQMFKSVVSNMNQSNQKSRVFSSRIKMDQSRIKQEQVLKITEHYTNGNKYYGEKKGPFKHGKGRYDLADGSHYDGEWHQNKISGRGILYFKNGQPQYDGQWRSDLYNGWGTLYSQISNWKKYEGEFKNGVKEGRGRIYFRDGSIYDGEFRGDKISGRGRKVNPNGQVIQKYWDTISPELFF